jgi:hypothetical protein
VTRSTWHYDEKLGRMVEGPGPRRVDGPSGDGWRFSDRHYSGKPFVGKDGTVIDSRKKHREYMKRHGLATMDDFKETWAKAREKREAFYTGNDREERRERKQQIIDVVNRLSRG